MGAVVGHVYSSAGAERNIKPSAWPWSPSSVRPEWQSLLKELTFAAPLWRDFRDYISKIVGVPENAAPWWETVGSGVGYQNVEDDGLQWAPNGSAWRPLGDAEFTFMVAWHPIALMSGLINYSVFTQVSSETTNGAWIYRRPFATNNMQLLWRVGGVTQDVTWTNGWVRPRPPKDAVFRPEILRTDIVTRKIGGTYELWVNGISKGTESNATAPVDSGTHDLNLGILLPTAVQGTIGTYMTAMLWQRALTDREARAVGEDPYGLWRPPRTYLG